MVVKVKFPLVLQNMGPFRIYKVENFAVPVNDSGFLHTRVKNIPKFVAINTESGYFARITAEMIKDPSLNSLKFNIPLMKIHQK